MAPRTGNHNLFYIVIIVSTAVLYVLNLFAGALANQQIPNDIFRNTTGDLSNLYRISAQPADWTFGVWSVIYAWGVVSYAYGISTLFRKGDLGYLYIAPCHLPPLAFAWYGLSSVLTVVWLVVWDRELLEWALYVILAIFVTLGLSLFFSFRSLACLEAALISEGMKKEIWLTRILVQSGIALNAAWVAVASTLNLGVCMTYKWDVNYEVAGSTTLCALCAVAGIYVFVDLLLLDQYARYIITPHLLLVWAATGILVENWEMDNSNSVFSAFVLAAAILATITKIVVMLWRRLHK